MYLTQHSKRSIQTFQVRSKASLIPSACASLLKLVCAAHRSKTAASSCSRGAPPSPRPSMRPKGPPWRCAIQASKRATRASAWVSSRYSEAGPPKRLGRKGFFPIERNFWMG